MNADLVGAGTSYLAPTEVRLHPPDGALGILGNGPDERRGSRRGGARREHCQSGERTKNEQHD